jgi:hypothetical protein
METTIQKTLRKPMLPLREADLVDVARTVLRKWETEQGITLKWTNQEKFKAEIDRFELSFAGRRKARGSRSVLTEAMRGINKEINNSTQYVKNYLAAAYGKTVALAHYAAFGILRSGSIYIIPRDHDSRLASLRQLTETIATAPFAEEKYGQAYWTDILLRFEQIFSSAGSEDSEASLHVGIKRELQPLIRRTLNSLVLLIRANNPETWRDELRVWGFQKEKY